MSIQTRKKRPTWQETLDKGELILLPAAHDGLMAKLIEQAGFLAMQVGGFAAVGALRLPRH